MSLRVKALVFIGVTFVALVVFLALAADRVIFSSFRHLEVIKIYEQVDLENREFQRAVDELAQTCLDYSGWDQAWDAVGASNPVPLIDELADATMVNLRLRGAGIIDRNGGWFLKKGFDPERAGELPFPPLPERFLATGGPLLAQPLAGSGTHGLIPIAGELFLFAAQPILPTDRRGTPRGVFLMLRSVDLRRRSTPERHVDGLFGERAVAADSPVGFLRRAGLAEDHFLAGGEPVPVVSTGVDALLASTERGGEIAPPLDVRLYGDGAIAGTLRLADLEGTPALLLRVRTTRPIHHLGRATRHALWLSLLISSLTFGALCLWLLRRYVLDRVETFTVTLERLAEDPQLELTLEERGADEVTKMARVFNRMREARDALRHALEEANAELDSFNSSVSHDLRAPARHLSGFADILLEDHGREFSPEVRDLVLRIREGAKRLGDVVDALLRLSRFGREEPQLMTLDLSEMVRQIAWEALEQAPEPLTEVVIAPDLKAFGDPGWMRHLLENLVSNAVKFTRRSSAPRIEFGAELSGGETVFFLKDNGVGFEPVMGSRLFKPFARLHDQKEYPGHGIGLVIVKRVIKRHGGWVTVESQPGRGTTFRFTLPCEKTTS